MLRKPHSAVALCLSFVVLLAAAIPYDRNDYDPQEVISSLSRVLDFFHREYKSINLDGIFGLRVAQGAFLSIMNDVRDGQLNIDNHVLNQVKGLYNKASVIAGDSLPFLKQSAPAYFEKFRKQVSDPWVNFKPFTSKKLQKRQYVPQKRRNMISFDEETSDRCMSELTGTGLSSDSNKPCQISDRCWGLISAKGAEGYTLTHQALFLQLGEVQGCTLSLLKRLEQSHISGGLEEIYNRICSDMYPQMTAIERRGESNQNFGDRDLYMEQAMVCASAGYHNFLSSKRLRRILTWQRKDGCFGEQKHVYRDNNYQDTDTDEQQNENIDDAGNKFETPFGDIKQSLEDEYSKILRKPLSVSMKTMRSLLVEKELDDGCMSHLTGVATGLLGVYLRWLLYPKVQQEKMEVQKSQDHNQLSAKAEMYTSDNLAGVIAQRERQLQQQKKRKEGQLQSAHLRKMRRAAMLGNSAQELLIREGSGSIPWGVVVLGSCCVFLVLWVMFIKGFKGSLHKLKTVALTKKSSHVI